MFPVAILAGGLATRMRPITETVPKALIPVSGVPFILRQLAYLRDQRVDRVVLCVGYLGEAIENIVGDGRELGLQVDYSFDGSKLLGTGGALKKASALLGDHFFVLYGDSFLPIDFSLVQDSYVQFSRPALMTVLRNEGLWDRSNVLFEEGRLVEYNKRNPKPEMKHIDYGLGVVNARLFDRYASDVSLDLADFYHELSMSQSLAGLEVQGRFYEIGSPAGLRQTEEYFSLRSEQ